ncbi:serine threonine protein kinase [Leptolyngbya sp. Heron Island J]|uniref:AAA-like domain-containing protein n=1 Tax=Leptolyngbya sp. Heron Island J TaxID=1385935 RepID=UPI0003B95E1B|nr:AAA-like domain-containing protein [Leptolyngbya sp. Heron Island J]ESA38534.1 serine threonine protein kinase [Leptolyngbya sp. Heron Island J]
MSSSSFSIDADAALEFVDRLVYSKTEKHLSDLERKVFVGSWEGKTYEEIYPFKPDYIEKSVGYKLWHKISDALGERLTKKRLRGAIERAIKQQTPKQITIIYRDQVPDAQLAETIGNAVQPDSYPFLANLDTVSNNGSGWVSHLETKLTSCHYFILLLSAQMAMSEMLIELLQRIWEQHINNYNEKPRLLVLHLQTGSSFSLNHALRNYLKQAQQYLWTQPGDENILYRDLLHGIQTGHFPQLPSGYQTEHDQQTPQIISTAANHAHTLLHTPPPSPVADPEIPRGQVRLESAFYIERQPQDTQCYDEILKPGALIRIKAPRQMGKTSLMARILSKAEDQEYQTIPLSFQHADREIFNSLEQLLRWLCLRVARKLNVPPRLEDFWTDAYGSKDNCTAYFEDYLLPEIATPLVLGMDEVDRVFQYTDIVDDFFGLLRAWYEEAGYGVGGSSLWEKLRLVVVHSTEGYIPLDINQSPFNVGLPIELKEFNLEQVTDLAHRHGLSWNTEQIQQLMLLIGGHPYLVRFAFYHIVQRELTWKQLLTTAPTESGIYGDHLRRHLWNLNRDPVLAAAFSQVLASQAPVSLESAHGFKLHSLGLVKLQGNGVVPSFDLYRQYFNERLQP